MVHVWKDSKDGTHSYVPIKGTKFLMEVSFNAGIWHIRVINTEFTRKGLVSDLNDVKQLAEGNLRKFLTMYSLSDIDIQLANVTSNFKKKREGVSSEIDSMLLLLRRVFKITIEGKLQTKKATDSFTVQFPRKLADSITNYLFTKDACMHSRKDLIRIVTLGKLDLIKNVDWRELVGRFRNK